VVEETSETEIVILPDELQKEMQDALDSNEFQEIDEDELRMNSEIASKQMESQQLNELERALQETEQSSKTTDLSLPLLSPQKSLNISLDSPPSPLALPSINPVIPIITKPEIPITAVLEPLETIHETSDPTVSITTTEPVNPPEEETDNLSDIELDEVQKYMNTAEEVEMKTQIWTEMNKDYLLMKQRKELEAATEAAANPNKKKRKREPRKQSAPAETAAEATAEMLKKKTPSNKINYSALANLFASFDTTKTKLAKITDSTPEEQFLASEEAARLGYDE